jgi:hypothetical protein
MGRAARLVVEPREAPLVFANELGSKRPLAIAWHLDRHRTVIGEHRAAAEAAELIALNEALRRCFDVAGNAETAG